MEASNPFYKLVRSIAIILSILIGGTGILTTLFNESVSHALNDYHADIVVYEDKRCEVVEHFEVSGSLKERTERKMQYNYWVTLPDGSKARYRQRIEKIEGMLSLTEDAGMSIHAVDIPIRVQEDLLNNCKECELSYQVVVDSDFGSEDNQLFYGIVGNTHKEVINGISFSVEMPKAISEENIQVCEIDRKGNLIPVVVNLQMDGNKFHATYGKTLFKDTGLALLIDVEDDYFKPAFQWKPVILLLLLILIYVFCYYIWFHYGKEKFLIVDTVEFESPNGLNSIELSYFYDGYVSQESVLAMFFTMAGKGYIRIEKFTQQLGLKKVYSFTKIRDYDGANTLERYFMEEMFRESFVVSTNDFLNENSYYRGSLCRFQNIAREYLNRNHPLYVHNTRQKNWWNVLGILVSYVLVFILASEPYIPFLGIRMVWHFCFLIFFVFFFAGLTRLLFARRKIWVADIGFTLFGILMLALIWVPTLIFEPLYIAVYIMGMFTILSCVWFFNHFSMRAQRYANLKGKILGYKKFLQHVENNRINVLFKDNKLLYYEVVANAYVLKVNWKWVSELEDILIPLEQ